MAPPLGTQVEIPNERLTGLLNGALARLKKQNPLVSLRSVAGRVEVSPSYLSKIMRGERELPNKLISPLAKALQLDHHEISELQRLILKNFESSELSGKTGIRTLEKSSEFALTDYQDLGKTEFWMLEEWYHLPLLNLITTEGFNPSPEWMAGRLGITPVKAQQSLGRMIKEGYVGLAADGSVTRTRLKVRFPTARSHAAIREFHQNMIRKADKILAQPATDKEFAERLISGVTFAGDPAQIPAAKLIMEEAMYRAAEVLAGGNCTEVFQLNLQMFKLTTDQD
jgi:uncharacterized protein (TIGR02147 family)